LSFPDKLAAARLCRMSPGPSHCPYQLRSNTPAISTHMPSYSGGVLPCTNWQLDPMVASLIPSTTTVSCINACKYKTLSAPNLSSGYFSHREVTGYRIVCCVSFPSLLPILNLSKLYPLSFLRPWHFIHFTGTLTVQRILDVTDPTNAPV
jgi:hypothetical protein